MSKARRSTQRAAQRSSRICGASSRPTGSSRWYKTSSTAPSDKRRRRERCPAGDDAGRRPPGREDSFGEGAAVTARGCGCCWPRPPPPAPPWSTPSPSPSISSMPELTPARSNAFSITTPPQPPHPRAATAFLAALTGHLRLNAAAPPGAPGLRDYQHRAADTGLAVLMQWLPRLGHEGLGGAVRGLTCRRGRRHCRDRPHRSGIRGWGAVRGRRQRLVIRILPSR